MDPYIRASIFVKSDTYKLFKLCLDYQVKPSGNTTIDLSRRYTVRFARTKPADCPVHVKCDMSFECPGHVKIA